MKARVRGDGGSRVRLDRAGSIVANLYATSHTLHHARAPAGDVVP